MKFSVFSFQCSVFLLAASVSRAETPLEVKLVSEVTSIQPGKAFYVGLHLHHGPGYHSYWKFPGIVGVPTHIQWKLPAGFVAGEIEWPEPESVLMFKIKAQGFERDVLLPVKITPPSDLKVGEIVKLEGKASWMSCARTCHPGFGDVSLKLPVKSETPAFDDRLRAMFQQERERVARRTDAWKASAVESGQTVTLTLVPSSLSARKLTSEQAEKIIFFTEDGWIDSDKPQTVKLHDDASVTISMERSEVYLGKEPPRELIGIVQIPSGWCVDAELRSMPIAPVLER
jgi:DsbC/DsbD-like thiol-disulfide interchange protein